MDKKYNNFITSNVIYMVVIACFIVLLFINGHLKTGLISITLYGLLVIYNIKNSRFKKNEWKKFIENFSEQLGNATKSILLTLPFPFVIISDVGNILWYNQKFILVTGKRDVLNKSFDEIISGVNIKHVLEGKKNIFSGISFQNKFYDIYANVVETSHDNEGKIILLYLYDVTDVHDLRKRIQDNRDSVVLIEVDNFDEVMKSTDEDKKPLLIAEIERTINSYAQSLNAMLKKYSTNKYVMIVQDKYIISEMGKKFDILDVIKEISEGNKLAVTLSMGIGRGGDTPIQNESLAMSAKELALGRGGDQAVVKSIDKLDFYGGKTKEVEKRTKVRSRVIAHALVDLLSGSDRVFIMGHMNPDIDCLGSALGLRSIINKMGKECYIILNGINNSIKLMMEEINNDKEYKDAFIDSRRCVELIGDDSLLILVDVHSRSYVQDIEIVDIIKKIVIVDHHRKATDFVDGALLSYIEPYASSTSELVTEMIQYMTDKPKLKVIEAEALLAGICVDTKNFYFKTGVRTFEAASFLRKLGADTLDVKRLFSNDLQTYLKKAEIIKSAEVNNNIAIAVCPPEIQDSVLAAQAADELLNITGIQASFVLATIGEEIIISARSLGNINVQIILERLGGGGHMTMAGARLKDVSIQKALNMLKENIDKCIMKGEQK